ncbi:hypothetical protein niasHS_016792 [Heterodera schachtii]|uniref:Uncharacterized protein n=1 Tax=Heterodera schachtii TaxID=97005 RepID=A0ABD2HSL3_HETSC
MLTYFSGFIHRKQDNEGYLSLTVATIDEQDMYSLSLLGPDNARLVMYQQHKMYDDLMEANGKLNLGIAERAAAADLAPCVNVREREQHQHSYP